MLYSRNAYMVYELNFNLGRFFSQAAPPWSSTRSRCNPWRSSQSTTSARPWSRSSSGGDSSSTWPTPSSRPWYWWEWATCRCTLTSITSQIGSWSRWQPCWWWQPSRQPFSSWVPEEFRWSRISMVLVVHIECLMFVLVIYMWVNTFKLLAI